MDYKNWLVKAEIDRYEQVDASKGLNNVYKYALVGVGYQFGKWTPMYTFSKYTTVQEPIEARNSQYLSLRWDFRKDTALKIQYDISKDKSHYPYPFFGDSKLISVSLQGIF
jgi:predicted porin